jgi:hypothetical protein
MQHRQQRTGKGLWGEAHEIVRSVEQGLGRAYQMLKLAAVAAEINPELGFDAMDETMAVINDAGTTVGNDLSSGAGERIQFFGRFDFDESLALLARADFERALQLAKSVKPKELATLMQFAACKGVLSKPTELPSKAK